MRRLPLAGALFGVAALVAVVAASVSTSPALASITATCATPVDSGGCADFVVPDGVTAVTIEVWGAAGGSGGLQGSSGCPPVTQGQLGGYVKATYAVSPGDTLHLYVGARGSDGVCGGDGGAGGTGGMGGNDDANGGTGGAGIGGTSLNNGGGGGGGGETDVRLIGNAPGDRIVIAGGGGGTGGTGGGGGFGGGSPAGNGGDSGGSTAHGGHGAIKTAVGTGGSGGGSGGDGSSGNGGVGGIATDNTNGAGGGGGGGGGIYGGGGGGAGVSGDGGAGGGGGSGGVLGTANLVQPPTNGVDANNSGNGKIVITYTEPPVTGSPALNVTATSATLVGYDENNDTYHFEYGTDPRFATSTSTTPASATPGATLQNTVTALTPGTTYYFRIDSSEGGPAPQYTTFRTLLLPVTGAASAVTGTAATVQGTDPNSGESYHFEYGTTTSYGTSTPSATNGGGTLSASLTGLQTGATYHYRIVSAAGSGSDATFTTLGRPLTGPAASVTSTSATLQGIDRNSGSSYHFEYGKTNAYGTSTPAAPSAGNSSFVDAVVNGLSPGTTYHFRIVDSVTGAGLDGTFTTLSGSKSGTRDLVLGLRGPATGSVGKSLRYVATIGDKGTVSVTGAKLTLSFKGGSVKIVSAPGCKGATALTCALPKIAGGRAVRVTVVVRETKAAVLTVKGNVVARFTDPTPKNNRASKRTIVK